MQISACSNEHSTGQRASLISHTRIQDQIQDPAADPDPEAMLNSLWIPHVSLHDELVSPSIIINLYVLRDLRPMGISWASPLPPCCPHSPRQEICGMAAFPAPSACTTPPLTFSAAPALPHGRPPLSHGSPDYPSASRPEGNVVASPPVSPLAVRCVTGRTADSHAHVSDTAETRRQL